MQNINLGVFDTEKTYATHLGKKGTASDYTIYNHKGQESYLCAYEPTGYPEKLSPLLYCASMTDFEVLVPRQPTRELGEMIVLLDSLEKKAYVDYSYMDREGFERLVAGTALAGAAEAPPEGPVARDFFANLVSQSGGNGGLYIPVDSAFAVKSVGTVALGQVYGRGVEVHEELEVFPTGKKCAVRSLQVHDEDVSQAGVGSRVGLALKGLDAGEIERGCVLAPPGSIKCAKKFTLKAKISKFYRDEIKSPDQIFASCCMSYKPIRVLGIERSGQEATISAETVNDAQMAFPPGAKVVLAKPEGKMRIIGSASIEM
ncbi:hypothetical protein FJZ26_05745 [Candidatus Parvarchaeota archaeon]|nr:hypothetical protein [Candidatus Parvarchaeota archaeon]